MWTKEIDTSFVGFTEDGAQWLLDNTDIKLVGKKLCSQQATAHMLCTIDHQQNSEWILVSLIC